MQHAQQVTLMELGLKRLREERGVQLLYVHPLCNAKETNLTEKVFALLLCGGRWHITSTEWLRL